MTLVVSAPRRVGTSYTFRGELEYQGKPMSKSACAASKLAFTLRKLNGGKAVKGKPAAAGPVGLFSIEGQCVFAKKYSFYKSFRGKNYRFELTATSKRTLPVQTGGPPRKPAAVTTQAVIRVGK